MAATKVWTLEEVHSLPDDGNKYELLNGELLVTPPPSRDHETIGARLQRILDPFVARHALGLIFRPRSILRIKGSELEPDLMVQAEYRGRWEDAPLPRLIIEIHSPSTRRRDLVHKRNFYMEVGIEEYWMLDPENQTLTAVRNDRADVTSGTLYAWHPAGVDASLTIEIAILFE